MNRDDINPRPGDVWVGNNGTERHVDGLDGGWVNFHEPATPRIGACLLSPFRDWVGRKGYRKQAGEQD